MRPVRDEEWDTLPHTFMTKPEPWNPKKYDCEVDPEWVDSIKKPSTMESRFHDLPFDQEGRMKDTEVNEPLSVTSREVKAYLTKLVSNEWSDIDILSQTFDVDSKSIDFGRLAFPAEQSLQYPKRNRKKIDYSEGRRKQGAPKNPPV